MSCPEKFRPVLVCFGLLVSIVLTSCGGGGGGGSQANTNTASGITTITIRTFIENANTPAEDDVNIIINGVNKGITGADGTMTLDVDSGTTSIQAFIPGLIGGTTTENLASDQNLTIDIIMTGEGLLGDAQLTIDELVAGIQGSIINQNFSSFTLRFLDNNSDTVPLKNLDDVSIRPADGGAPIYLLDFFKLASDGSIEVIDLDGLRTALLGVQGEVTLQVHGDGKDGRTYGERINFHIGRYSINGRLSAPPSNPALSVANIAVKATLLSLNDKVIEFESTSDATGIFSLSNIPIGTLSFSVSIEANGKIYNGFGTVSMNANKDITINLLTTEDVINGVPNLEVTDSPIVSALLITPIPGTTKEKTVKRIAPFVYTEPINNITAIEASAAVTANVTVAGGSEDFRNTQSATLDIPAGTEKITLKYKVSTAEYPTYVEKQSQYDDVWELKVLGNNGSLLFAITSRVNAQLNIPPQWQTDGSTGDIIEELNISDLTANDTTVTLFAASTNVGDGAFTTTVTASLSFEPDFRITAITPDVVNPTNSNSEYYSIPRQGESNINHRFFTLKLAGRPKGATIKNVTAELFQESSPTSFMTVADQGVDGVIVTEKDETTLEVRVTNGNPDLPTDPPGFHKLGYRFTVTADNGGTELTTPQKQSGRRLALWRMPESVTQRTGERLASHDDWASKGTYEWVQQNLALLTAVNDISGEHARNIGHATHFRGTDIDMYHFTHLLGTADRNGTLNYLEVRKLVVRGLDCQVFNACTSAVSDQIVSDLSDWMTTAKTKLDALTAPSLNVAEVIFANGTGDSVLPEGWLKTLLTTGKVTDDLGRTLDLGIGAWSNGKVKHRNDHNNHIHIDLDDSKLNNSP